MVGAKTLSGIARPSTPLYNFSIEFAPKNNINAAKPPVHTEITREQRIILFAFLYCFLTNLADISLETAIGKP